MTIFLKSLSICAFGGGLSSLSDVFSGVNLVHSKLIGTSRATLVIQSFISLAAVLPDAPQLLATS